MGDERAIPLSHPEAAGYLTRVHHHAAHAHHALRHKFLDVASLPRALRVAVGIGTCGTLGGLLLLAARDMPFPRLAVGPSLTTAPVFLAAVAAIMTLAWTYVLAGSIGGHPVVRIVVLALFVHAVWPLATAGGWSSGGMGATAASVLMVFWRGRRGASARYGRDAAVLGALVAAVHLFAAIDAFRGGIPYGVRLFEHLLRGVYYPLPILIIAGLDLAELTAATGSWVVAGVRRFATPAVLGGLVLAFAVLKIVLDVHGGVGAPAAWIPATAALLYLVLLMHFRPCGAVPEAAPYWLLLAFALSYLTGPVLASLALVAGHVWLPGGEQHAPEVGWLTATAGWLIATAAVFARRHHTAHRPVRWVMATLALWLALVLAPDGLNALLGGHGRLSSLTLPALDAQISALLFAITAYLLASRRGHARVYAALLTILAALTFLGLMSELLNRNVGVGDIVNLAQLALVLVSALAVARLETRSAIPWPAVASGAVVAGLLLYLLLTAREPTQRIYLVQVAALILSVGWDLLMSGERFANGDSRVMPRASRIFFYFGAMLITAATMIWFNTTQGLDPGYYQPGVFPRWGLVMLGTPLLLLSLLRIVRGEEAVAA